MHVINLLLAYLFIVSDESAVKEFLNKRLINTNDSAFVKATYVFLICYQFLITCS